jgi:hypothetical protein
MKTPRARLEPGRVLEALASLRLAVALMISLALACTLATFYESKQGTAAAQRDFYGSVWFGAILALLGLNIFASMMKRWPWRSHHAGFVTAHVGILLLLLGSLISLHLGLDSNMALYEGETTDRVSLLGKSLQVALPDGRYATFDVDFDRRPPGPGHERRFTIPGSDVSVVAQAYRPHVRAGEGAEAVQLRLETPRGSSAPEWLVWTESGSVDFGGSHAHLAYRFPEMAVPFRVTLLKFASEKYPGSNMAASYESWVRVDDPERGVSQHHISMNNPLHYRGYVFFQASFVEGEPMMSIFSVTRAPGLPFVYAGVAFVSFGVIWMFYLRPYLARRRGVQALRASDRRVATVGPREAPARP